jgi:hypothetical protein
MKPGIAATFLLISMSVPQFSSLRMPNEPLDQDHQASAAAIAILDESHSHPRKTNLDRGRLAGVRPRQLLRPRPG